MICPAGVGAKPILVYLLYSFGDNFLIKISFSKHGLHEAEASALRENIQKKGSGRRVICPATLVWFWVVKPYIFIDVVDCQSNNQDHKNVFTCQRKNQQVFETHCLHGTFKSNAIVPSKKHLNHRFFWQVLRVNSCLTCGIWSGENAYYYAHNRKFEVPPDAKVISGRILRGWIQQLDWTVASDTPGPGLVTGILAADGCPTTDCGCLNLDPIYFFSCSSLYLSLYLYICIYIYLHLCVCLCLSHSPSLSLQFVCINKYHLNNSIVDA